MYGKDYAYADTRLRGTTVRKIDGGIPVLCEGINGRGECGLFNFETNAREVLHLDALDLTPVPLGFVNYRARAVYLARVPLRAGPRNQGLRAENSTTFHGQGYPPMGAVSKTIINSFPSFANAFTASSKNKDSSCAWHRHWAVGAGSILLYKAQGPVGTINKDKHFVLKNDFQYLNEYLTEVLYG